MSVLSKLKEANEKLKSSLKKLKRRQKSEHPELQKIESKLKKLQAEEKSTQDHLIWSDKTMFKFWFFGLIIVGVGFFAYQSLDMIFLIFMALIIAVAMEAIIDFFQKKLHRGIAIGITYLLLIVFILGGLIFIIPFIAEQISAVLEVFVLKAKGFQEALATKSLPGIIEEIQWIPKYFKSSIMSWIQDPAFYVGIQNDLQENLSNIIGISTEYAKEVGSVAFNFFTWLAGVIGQAAIVLTLSVLFSIEKKAVIKFIAGIAGHKKREYLQTKVERIYKKLGLWLKGQVLLCLFIAIAVFVSLLIMSAFGVEIPSKGSLAVIAGLTELVPYLGPILGGIPAVLVVGLHNGIPAALATIGVFAIIQWIENNVLIPVVMNKTLGINPVVIFISIIVGGLVMGFAGVLLAVPIAVVITMFLDDKFE